MYLAANTGRITSSDFFDVLSVSVSPSGVLAKAYLGYSPTGRSLSARGADATSSITAHNFSTMTLLRIGHWDYRSVLCLDKETRVLSDPAVGC